MSTSPSARDSAAYPYQAVFIPFPFVCFTLALLTDLAYWQTANLMWVNFSAWLLFAGLVFGALGLLAGLLDLARSRTRPLRPGFVVILLYIAILALAIFNSLLHAGDGWTAIVPFGLVTSAVTVVLMIFTASLSSRKYARLAWRI